jgi:hypothetical protein
MLFFACFHYLKKKKRKKEKGIILILCVCICIPHKLLNVWTSLFETQYTYHVTWAHLNGLLHKLFPSVCVCMSIPLSFSRQRLGKHIPAATNTRNNRIVVCIVSMRSLYHNGESVGLCVPKSKLLYYWRFTANQFFLATSPWRMTTRDFFCCNWTLRP